MLYFTLATFLLVALVDCTNVLPDTNPQQQPTKAIPKPFSFTTLIDGASLTTVKVFSRNGFRKEMRDGKNVLVMDLPPDNTFPSIAEGTPTYIAIAESQNNIHGWFKVTKTTTSKFYSFECQTSTICGMPLMSMYVLGLTNATVRIETPVIDRLATISQEVPIELGVGSMASFGDLVDAYSKVGLANIVKTFKILAGDGVGPMVTSNSGDISLPGSNPSRYYFIGYDIGKPLNWWNRFGGSITSDNIFLDLRCWYDMLPIQIFMKIQVSAAVFSNPVFLKQSINVPFLVSL